MNVKKKKKISKKFIKTIRINLKWILRPAAGQSQFYILYGSVTEVKIKNTNRSEDLMKYCIRLMFLKNSLNESALFKPRAGTVSIYHHMETTGSIQVSIETTED